MTFLSNNNQTNVYQRNYQILMIEIWKIMNDYVPQNAE